MSILERSTSPQTPPAGPHPRSDRLRVITAGGVDNMEAGLGASGFDVVAVAQTEDALIDAVSVDEPDAIIVEADLCASLEHVRDLAPDAVLIVIGDHTPAGALGRIERGVSGTTMAGLLHALVANGIGAAAPWGLVPAFGPRSALQVPQRISVWLLSEKADLVRGYVVNALRDHVELAAATTAAVTVSAGLVLTMSAARSNEPPRERPQHVHVVAPAAERALQYPAAAVFPTTPTPAYGPSGNEGEPGGRWGQNRGESRADGRHVGEDADLGQGENAADLGQGEAADDLGQGENADDLGQGEAADDLGQGENADDLGQGESAGDHGQGENAGGHGQGENAGGHGKGESAGDNGKGGDESNGDEQDGNEQDGDESDGDESDGDESDGDESDGGDQDVGGGTATAAETSALSPATGVALTY